MIWDYTEDYTEDNGEFHRIQVIHVILMFSSSLQSRVPICNVIGNVFSIHIFSCTKSPFIIYSYIPLYIHFYHHHIFCSSPCFSTNRDDANKKRNTNNLSFLQGDLTIFIRNLKSQSFIEPATSPKHKEDFHQLVGGWATPLKNMKVNWDD